MQSSGFELSIIVPTLGIKSHSLKALLSSIEWQNADKSKYEVLLIQNGTNFRVNLDPLLKQFSDLQISLYKIDATGVNAARAFGLSKAQGSIVLMLDDDVELPDSNYFLRLSSFHKQNPEVLAYGGAYKSLKSAPMLDRVYNLDAYLSLRSNQRGRYSIDLLGGCVSYKRNKLHQYGLMPNSELVYGATETEFHHRLFRAGALLKYERALSIYHNPQMTWLEHLSKAFRQGRGFKNYCYYDSGLKRKVLLNSRYRFAMASRELFYSWGSGEAPIVRVLYPLNRFLNQCYDKVHRLASSAKWKLVRLYGDFVMRKLARRTKHYASQGTIFIQSSTQMGPKLLRHSWPSGNISYLFEGICHLELPTLNKELLAIDITKRINVDDLKISIQKFSNRAISFYCSNDLLTPYELKRNVKLLSEQLQMAKYKYKLSSVTLVDGNIISRWPEFKLVWENKNRPKHPKISVVIPFFNNSLFLKRVLQSLCFQNYDKNRYEIILASDGSAIEHVDAVRDFALQNQHTSISILQWEKAADQPKEFRAGMARQIGSMYARGEYLTFLDSDIVVQADYLSQLEKSFVIYDVVQAKRRMLDEKGTQAIIRESLSVKTAEVEAGIYKEEPYWENFKETKDWESLWSYWKYTCTYCLSIKRKTFFDLGGFRPQYNRYGFEDVDLGYRAYLSNLRFGYLNSDVFHLYPVGAGAVHHFDSQGREALLVKSCETFYRLNLSPALYEEFEFFLRGRNLNYHSLKMRDYIQLSWWKDYFHSMQHQTRLCGQKAFWRSYHFMKEGQGQSRKVVVVSYNKSMNLYYMAVRAYHGAVRNSVQLYWLLYGLFGFAYEVLSFVYYKYVHRAYYKYGYHIYYKFIRPVLMKPYYFTAYQLKKYALLENTQKDVRSGLAKERKYKTF